MGLFCGVALLIDLNLTGRDASKNPTLVRAWPAGGDRARTCIPRLSLPFGSITPADWTRLVCQELTEWRP